MLQELIEAVREAQTGPSPQLVLCLCPATDVNAVLAEQINQAESALVTALGDEPGVRVLTSQALQQIYPCARVSEPHGERLASMPYTTEAYGMLGTALARSIYGLTVPAHKVLVLDCDDTLWGGLCSELGAEGVAVTPEHIALQRFAREQREDGKLICLASRNNEADVLAVFDRHPGMTLSRDDLTAWEIHWGLKSDSLAQLAGKLGLGLDSFVFIDDDPVQCAEVRRRFPEVLALQLPKQNVGEFCRHIWPLDPRSATAEGARRTIAYRHHAAREDVRAASQSFAQFLDSLELRVDMETLSEQELARASELTHRTNQFNLTGLRLNEAELRHRLQQESGICVGVRVRDRFGDYGLVGLILGELMNDELRVPILLLSCRALGRGVEQRMVACLGRLAREQGAARIALHCTPTQRNDPAQQFLRDLGNVRTQGDGALELTLDTEAAETITLDLAAAPHYEDESGEPGNHSEPRAPTGPRDRVDFLARVPLTLAGTEAISAAVHAEMAAAPPAADDTPDAVVSQLLNAFREHLGVDDIPLDASFFELGGESLQAMQILARVSQAFDIELDTTLLFTTNFTVEELAEEIRGLCDPDGGDAAASSAPFPAATGP